MRKYIVIEVNKLGDERVSVFDTLTEANEYAREMWQIIKAQAKRVVKDMSFLATDNDPRILVRVVSENDLSEWAVDEETGGIDWTCYNQYDYNEDCFDSEVVDYDR